MVEAPPRHPACSTSAVRAPHRAAATAAATPALPPPTTMTSKMSCLLIGMCSCSPTRLCLPPTVREPSKLGCDSDKLHPVTARCARRNLLRVSSVGMVQIEPSVARRIEKSQKRPPSDVKTAVSRDRVGRADPLCTVVSHVDLLGDCQGVIDLDAEVAHRALNPIGPTVRRHNAHPV